MKRSVASVVSFALIGALASGCGTLTGGAVGAGAAIYDITKHNKKD